MSDKSEYERQREERIARNRQKLQTLNVPKLHPEPSKSCHHLTSVLERNHHSRHITSAAGINHNVSVGVKPRQPSDKPSKKRAAPLLHVEAVR